MRGLIDKGMGYVADIIQEPVRTNSATVSRASGSSTTQVAVLDSALPAGKWLVTVWGSYQSSSSGARGLNLTFSNMASGITANVRMAATPTTRTNIELVQIVDTDSGTTVVLNGFQNSGATLDLSYQYTAVRLA